MCYNRLGGSCLTYENNSDQFETQEQELQLEIAELEREKQGWDVALANLDQLRRMPDFDPKAWFKMFQDDTVALSTRYRNNRGKES